MSSWSHGAFADGSGRRSVADMLERDGYSVAVEPEPATSVAHDIAAAKRMIERVNAPLIPIGHSYGGVVITEAGNAPQVRFTAKRAGGKIIELKGNHAAE
jgi:hypothetical protein